MWELATKKMRRLTADGVHPSSFEGAHLRWTPDSRSIVALLEAESPSPSALAAREANAATEAADRGAAGLTVRVYRSELEVGEREDRLSSTGLIP